MNDSVIPEITDDDLQWASQLLGLQDIDEPRKEFLKTISSVDVSACPGSGKTTLIVAKLAMLANKWPFRTRGVCVLSHTNVAREVIQHRLRGTIVGQRILTYPHFVDTIHGFVNRFLALPWLHSNGYPVVMIDDDATTGYRRRILDNREYRTVCAAIERNNRTKNFADLRICSRDLAFDLKGAQFPGGESTPSYQAASKSVCASARAGYFCHDEMFVWASALIGDHPEMTSWLAHRFPLVIIDEMQDTSSLQSRFLASAFPQLSERVVMQRVGDPNQAIFDGSDDSAEASTQSSSQPSRCSISIPNSYRFGTAIAGLASRFAVKPVLPSGLCGVGPRKLTENSEISSHAIFLFPDGQTQDVLNVFGKHVMANLPADLIDRWSIDNPDREPIHAVGAVHRDATGVDLQHRHFPKSVSHYWSMYRPESTKRDATPRSLLQYVRLAQSIALRQPDLYAAVERIAAGFIRLAANIGDTSHLSRNTRPHQMITNALVSQPEVLLRYRKAVMAMLIDSFPSDERQWTSTKTREAFIQIATALCNNSVNLREGDEFLTWSDAHINPQSTPLSHNGMMPINTYCVSDGDRSVSIQLGSIHSIKGQDHLATLVLDTFWHDHAFKSLLPWLSGERENGNNASEREKTRLLQTYVAMTRPSHLLCLAMKLSHLGTGQEWERNIARLQQQGWQVAEILDGQPIWQSLTT